MNESIFPRHAAVDAPPYNDSTSDGSTDDDPQPEDADLQESPPEFGLLDVVEAFTAMRHEWRGQTRESRQLTDAVRQAVTTLQELAAQRSDSADGGCADEARRLVELIIDVDHQLTRAIDAADRWETTRRRRAQADAQTLKQAIQQMSPLARWFARPLLTTLARIEGDEEHAVENPAVEGLNLVLARLRRTMRELQIERFDTLNRAFDANRMNAIGTLETEETPAGDVAEQLSPCYLWHGQLLRFADVRVAVPTSTKNDPTENEPATSIEG